MRLAAMHGLQGSIHAAFQAGKRLFDLNGSSI